MRQISCSSLCSLGLRGEDNVLFPRLCSGFGQHHQPHHASQLALDHRCSRRPDCVPRYCGFWGRDGQFLVEKKQRTARLSIKKFTLPLNSYLASCPSWFGSPDGETPDRRGQSGTSALPLPRSWSSPSRTQPGCPTRGIERVAWDRFRCLSQTKEDESQRERGEEEGRGHYTSTYHSQYTQSTTNDLTMRLMIGCYKVKYMFVGQHTGLIYGGFTIEHLHLWRMKFFHSDKVAVILCCRKDEEWRNYHNACSVWQCR